MDVSAQLLVLTSCLIVCAAEEFSSQYRASGGIAHAENNLSRQQLHQIQNNVLPALREVKNVSIPVHGHASTAFEQMTDEELGLDQSRAYDHNAHYAPHPSYHQPYPTLPPYPAALPHSYSPWGSSYPEPGLPGAQYSGSLYHPASKLSLFNPPSASVGIGKPIDSKAGKSGLGGIMSLLGGAASGGLQLDGVKELFINGFLRPLLVAKGNIKSLISKLIVPVLVLVLINLEILVVVWWLWEECPKGLPPPPPPPLSPPPPPPPTTPPYYPSYPKAAFNYY